VIASPFVVDANAAYVSSGTVPDYLPAPIQVAAGVGMHESGSLVYVAYQMDNAARSGIDIYDAHHGNLRERLLLSGALPYNVSGLSVLSIAIDEIGGRIFLVTTAGLTIINLDAVPLSLGSVTPNSGVPGAGLSLRGSGFTAGTTATFNGTSAAVTFVDADTLQTVVPASLASGPVSITLSNPDGSTYTLDDAFNIN